MKTADIAKETGAAKEARTYAVPALDRTLDIVEFMAERVEPIGMNELARELEVPVNSVFRILRRLAERGYVETAQEDGKGGYLLSTRFFSLGARLQTRFDLRNRARPHLEALAYKTGETCQLQILKDGGMLVQDVANPIADFFLQIVPGAKLNLHSNAMAKAVLAFMDEKEVKALVKPKLPALTEKTITDRPTYLKELQAFRETGLGYDREEYVDGIYCISTVVLDVNGEPVGSIGLTGMHARCDAEKWRENENYVLACGAAVARDIGYTGNAYTNWIEKGENQ